MPKVEGTEVEEKVPVDILRVNGEVMDRFCVLLACRGIYHRSSGRSLRRILEWGIIQSILKYCNR